MATRLTSRRFVGRREALQDLTAALEAAESGEPRLVFVAGESGVGKTRLVSEFLASRAGGARVLLGHSAAGFGTDLPFSSVRSALRAPLRDGDPEVTAVVASAGAELSWILGEFKRGPDEPGSPSREEVDETRTFEVLLGTLERLAETRPLVLVLEDLHWADLSTRDFLMFLTANLRDVPIVLVGTYRSDELGRRHPLVPALAELERSRLTRRISIDRFTRTEIEEQLADLLGAQPDAALVERLWARSGGNPLFTEELLAAGGDGDRPLPDSLRNALMLRIDDLPAVARQVLRAVAVGHVLDEDALASATGLALPEIREALREGLGHQVLVRNRDGRRYQFRHELLREAVVDDLLPGEAAEMNEALGDALSALPEPCSATVAQHYLDADCAKAALPWVKLAARDAESVHAYIEASEWWETGAGLADRLGRTDGGSDTEVVDFLSRAARAKQSVGRGRRARDLLHRALDRVDAETDRELASDLLLRLAQARWTMGDGDGALREYRKALAHTDPDQPTPARARALSWSSKILMLRGRYGEAVARADEALAAARATGEQREEGQALNTRGISLTQMGRGEEGVEDMRRSLALAGDADMDDVSRAYSNLGDVLDLMGRTEEALANVREGLRVTGEFEHAHHWLTMMIVELTLSLGQWPESRERLASKRTMPGTAGLFLFHTALHTEFDLIDGQTESAWRRVEDAIDRSSDSRDAQWHFLLGDLAGETLRRQRRLPEARAALDRALERARPPAGRPIEDHPRYARLAATTAAIEADAAEEAFALGHADEAEAARARARARVEDVRATMAASEWPTLPGARAHLAMAEAEVSRAEGRSDPDLWAAAAAEFEGLKRPYPAARAEWRRAEALVERGDRGAAAEVLRGAAAVADELGARWLATEIAGLAGRARLSLRATAAEEASAPEPLSDELGLTPRERQVLALVAGGATNREIGERLFMAEKTASVHVSRILAKLDVRSRTQAAAVAHRLGLASERSV